MSTVEKLKKQIAALSEEDRDELMWFLMPLNGYEWVPGDDPEFEAELNRRVAEIESGKDPGIPAEQVFAEMREKYGWKRLERKAARKKSSRKPLRAVNRKR